MPETINIPFPSSIPREELLKPGEVVLLVDDQRSIILLLRGHFEKYDFPVITAGSGRELREAFEQHSVALVFLDIGLPDADGRELIPEIKQSYPDTSIVMLTGVTDLQIALDCMRCGADDYLTKPVEFEALQKTLCRILEKRRLTINHQNYQLQLEQAHFRLQLLHELAREMNSAYLGKAALNGILQAVLVGIAVEEGLGFDRAFLALFDSSGMVLEGKMALGPGCRMGRKRHRLRSGASMRSFHDWLSSMQRECFKNDSKTGCIARALQVTAENTDHILIRAANEQKTICVHKGQSDHLVPVSLIDLLGTDCFVVVPLFSQKRSFGVIIADLSTAKGYISPDLLQDLESFASQASLAIEHCFMYRTMEKKITELETVTQQLEKNKDLLVKAERYSAVGHMVAQLVHSIRNPVTSIGGTARLLTRKTEDTEFIKLFDSMTRDANRIEDTLAKLYEFVEQKEPESEQVTPYLLIEQVLLLHYARMEAQGIEYTLNFPENEPVILADPELVQLVFVHLVRNALEAMPDGGSLEVEVSSFAGEVLISVRDSGEGRFFSDLYGVTNPFYTTKASGDGIGLALVKQIAEVHGGHFEIRQRKSGGAEAIVRFPETDSSTVA